MNRLFSIAILTLACSIAAAQDHPAFGQHQVSQLTVEADVPDIPKLEFKVVALLRADDPSLTLAAARARVRIDGKTDVARCMELLIIHTLRGITQAFVVGTVVATQHPEPAP